MINRYFFWGVIIGMFQFKIATAQNPIITHIYAADPSAHVWPGDTTMLWLYTSHDTPGTNH
ncbi:MAG: hypothetical protein Q8905_17135, partial [Bacteroidota bacterium]|nr:hypothetical protein [Bacteroidota bacterium]